jgi:hypothetical protein
LAFLLKKRAGLARDSATLKGYLVTQYQLVYNKMGVCQGASKLGLANEDSFRVKRKRFFMLNMMKR